MKGLKALLLSVVFFITAPCFAVSLYLEPSLGFTNGDFSWDSSLGVNESTVDGFVVGLRFGAGIGPFFVGPDLFFNPGSFNTTVPDPNIGHSQVLDKSASADLGFIGLTGGVEVPLFPVRAWAGVGILTYQLKFNADGSDLEFDGNSLKIGLGYKPGVLALRVPFSINFEYMVTHLTKVNGVGNQGGDKANLPALLGSPAVLYQKAKIESFIVTVSLPFRLFE